MFKHKHSQAGFGIVEFLCFVVMFSMVGLIGWYVVSENQRSKDTLDNIGSSEVETQTVQNSAKAGEKFVFKELGIQVFLPESIGKMTYEVLTDSNSKTSVFLYTPEFSKLAKTCLSDSSTTKHPFAMLQKVSNDSLTNSGNLLKKFDSFEIRLFETTGSKCDESVDQKTANDIKQLYLDSNKAIITAVKLATAIE